MWSNGISLWKTYQFVPHALTLLVAKVFGLTITRAMVVMTIALFVFLRLSIYIVLRLLHFSPMTAFICAILSFDISQYWEGVSEFSLLFGFTFFPIILFLWTKYFQGKLQLAYPYIAGLIFIIHPLLGLTSVALWAIALIFSERKIISLSVISQFLIIAAASSLAWYPLLVKTSYAYTNDFYKTRDFLNLILSNVDYYGLSLFLYLCFLCCLIRMFMPVLPKFQWTKILFLFVFLYSLLVVIGTHLDLPQIINQFQFTRGVTFIGIALIFSFAVVVEDMTKISSSAVRGLLLFIFSLAFVEGIWFSSIHSSYPGKQFEEPITAFMKSHPDIDLTQGRIWTPAIDTSSYLVPSNFRLPYSYMPQLESNQIPQRMVQLIMYQPYIGDIPQTSLDRLDDYFRISGTKYIFLTQDSPFTKAYVHHAENYADLGTVSLPHALYHVFSPPWEVRNGALIDPRYQKDIAHFPFSLQFSNVNDQVTLDDLVRKTVVTISKSENTPLGISYPTQETMQVEIPANRKSALVYINESFDPNWKAYLNHKQQKVEPAGPNYMMVTLADTSEKGTLFLRHTWPLSFYLSLYFIFLIPLEIFLINILVAWYTREKNLRYIKL